MTKNKKNPLHRLINDFDAEKIDNRSDFKE